MAGINRELDTEAGDYVYNGAGGTKTTRNAMPLVYHQGRLRRGSWAPQPDAGIRDEPLDQAKSSLRTEAVIGDIWREALSPLVEEGRITEPEIIVERDEGGDVIAYEIVTHDRQSGEELRLADVPELGV